jgi:hypothetical protein
VLWLLLLVGLPVLGLFALGAYLQPLDGDLTRLGYFAEREFGWNGAQVEFTRSRLLFPRSGADPGGYDGYHDVVVLGDSFAYNKPRRQWQNYLSTATGWSVATQNISVRTLQEVLASPVFQMHPPRVLIVESIERHLRHRLERNALPCGTASELSLQPKARRPAVDAEPLVWDSVLSGVTELVQRPNSWNEIKLGYVGRFVWNSTWRGLTGKEMDSVQVRLDSPAPFSSDNTHAMLVYEDDFKKVAWWREVAPTDLDCWIRQMRRQVEANGITRFVLMVPPDKLTAYADHVGDVAFRNASLLPRLAERHPEIMPRFDRELIEAVRRREQDIYLPNDTHWGSTGHRIAAETLIRFLAPTVGDTPRAESVPSLR